MNEIISNVTPLTVGIIWLNNGDLSPKSETYKAIDYLLNGLLTSTLNNSVLQNSHIFLGQNFGNDFYVLITHKVDTKELENFATLLKEKINVENDVLVIGEAGAIPYLQKMTPEILKTKLRFLK